MSVEQEFKYPGDIRRVKPASAFAYELGLTDPRHPAFRITQGQQALAMLLPRENESEPKLDKTPPKILVFEEKPRVGAIIGVRNQGIAIDKDDAFRKPQPDEVKIFAEKARTQLREYPRISGIIGRALNKLYSAIDPPKIV